MAAAKNHCFFAFSEFSELSESSPTVIQSSRFANDCKFGISVNTYQ